MVTGADEPCLVGDAAVGLRIHVDIFSVGRRTVQLRTLGKMLATRCRARVVEISEAFHLGRVTTSGGRQQRVDQHGHQPEQNPRFIERGDRFGLFAFEILR